MRFYAPTRISENIRETPEGYLICLNVPIARIGEMLYHVEELDLINDDEKIEPNDDGTVTISRTEKELFNDLTIASFQGKPLTINHHGMIEKDNWQIYSNGVMQNVRRGEGENVDDLLCDLMVTTDQAIDSIKNQGKRELSCGYHALLVPRGKGKAEQIEIKGNHLALVEKGRAGQDYAIQDGYKNVNKKGVWEMSFKKQLEGLLRKFADSVASLEEIQDEQSGNKQQEQKDKMSELIDMVKVIKDSLEGNNPKEELGEKKETQDNENEQDVIKLLKELSIRVEKLEKIVNPIEDEEKDKDSIVGDEDKVEDADDETFSQDTAERLELLAPGIKVDGKAKQKALKQFADSDLGKDILKLFFKDGKVFFDAANTDAMFVAVSEIVKQKNKEKNDKLFSDSVINPQSSYESTMSIDQVNKMNREFWNKQN